MKSCLDYISELREKIHLAEDQLRCETKNLCRTRDLFTEEKDRWTAEIREDERKVRSNEIQIKEKEAALEQLKASYEEVLKKCMKLEPENEKLKREIQKAKTEREGKMNVLLLEQASLEKELSKVQDHLKDVQLSNKWARVLKDKDLKAHEAEQESNLKEELKQMSDDFAKKMEAFDENLKHINKASLQPKKDRLAKLQETLAQIVNECKDYEEKNKALEKQIELLDKN